MTASQIETAGANEMTTKLQQTIESTYGQHNCVTIENVSPDTLPVLGIDASCKIEDAGFSTIIQRTTVGMFRRSFTYTVKDGLTGRKIANRVDLQNAIDAARADWHSYGWKTYGSRMAWRMAITRAMARNRAIWAEVVK